jgi:hypothetical protein
MNQRLSKDLRVAAEYRNQSATPGVMPFPGVARVYKHPVYATRITTKTTYQRLPLADKTSKVFTRVRHMVVDRYGKSVLEMETLAPGTVPVSFSDDGKNTPTAFNEHTLTRVKEQLVPVTKPARLDPQCAKGKYRALKRLARKGLLPTLGAAIIAAQQGKEVQA